MRKIIWQKQGTELYDCYVVLNDIKKSILKIDCSCYNFQNRRIKTFGLCAYKKRFADPCKHLENTTNALIKLGYKMKIPSMTGSNKPNAKLKRDLLERSNGICERNFCENNPTDIHRILPGIMGGKYSLDNCVFICNDCHKLIPK